MRVEGKFLVVGNKKFFAKGTTYGAFPPNTRGDQFPEQDQLRADFSLMRDAGINCILTYTVPPISLLDEAFEHGIRVIVNIPWMAYICFLQDKQTQRTIRDEVRRAVASCQSHPAVLMYCVAKEIPPPIVRWHGAKKTEIFLRELCETVKEQDAESLVTYTNFPTTEYLELPFLDVFTFNVYLHQRPEMCAYLSRLQHLAGELPFVLTELGICSYRHGRDRQAEFLSWQIQEAFDHGVAGAVVFGWTDPFFQDNQLITEWGFGLVDAERCPKPSYWAVKHRFSKSIPLGSERPRPRFSVVVAAHNAGLTLDSCLASLTRLRYANYEVIVVNDGSTDETQAIMRRYPRFRGITTPNQGVSAARNEGLRAASGEIVAYIDSDAEADPDWLSYLAITYSKFELAGAGGPNIVPPEDNWVAKCVYRSPGGPTQVMFDDTYAEHIPGCNMSFRKKALEEVGGFDPIFRAAADDVDICWRLIEKGHQIGFSPSAVVWHHRRPSVKAFWRQQVGYGVAESVLERKFPNKFNPWGHTFWGGRIYAPNSAFRLFGRPVIYHGLWGSAGFQPMYERGGEGALSFLPRAMEWHIGLAALAVLGLLFPWAFLPCAIGLLYTGAYCVHCAAKANIKGFENGPSSFSRRLRWRAMIAWLHFLEPMARDWGRIKGGLTPWRNVNAQQEGSYATRWWQRLQPFRRVVRWACAGEAGLDKYRLLQCLSDGLSRAGCAVGWNPTHAAWDLWTRRGSLSEAKIGAVIEYPGGAKRLARISALVRPSTPALWVSAVLVLVAAGLGALGFPAPAVLLGLAFCVLWVAEIFYANRLESTIVVNAVEAAMKRQSPKMAPIQADASQIKRTQEAAAD